MKFDANNKENKEELNNNDNSLSDCQEMGSSTVNSEELKSIVKEYPRAGVSLIAAVMLDLERKDQLNVDPSIIDVNGSIVTPFAELLPLDFFEVSIGGQCYGLLFKDSFSEYKPYDAGYYEAFGGMPFPIIKNRPKCYMIVFVNNGDNQLEDKGISAYRMESVGTMQELDDGREFIFVDLSKLDWTENKNLMTLFQNFEIAGLLKRNLKK